MNPPTSTIGEGTRWPGSGKNRKQTCGFLQYNRFCVVWFQAFSSEAIPGINSLSFCTPFKAAIDLQVFDDRFLNSNLLTRFRLQGFDITIGIANDNGTVLIEGHVHVEAALFFNTTISLTYRLVVNGEENFCRSNQPLTSDDIITLAGIPLGVEYSYPSDALTQRSWGVDFKITKFDASGLCLTKDGAISSESATLSGSNEILLEIMQRYRLFFLRSRKGGPLVKFHESKFVMVDIWEDIAHCGVAEIDFSSFSAPDIISHIEEMHQSELMGLLTLYPFEWPYRDSKAFRRVCGTNIAIDTDDLVLVSENVGLVIGTYGLRGAGAPTDWRGYLAERRSLDHVSWPECLHIIEIAVAQLHTINYALYVLHSTSVGGWPRLSSKTVIRRNSILALKLGRMITDMDVVKLSRYASHKGMYKEIAERLEIAKELEVLSSALNRIDTAIKNIDSVEELRRSRLVRILLAFITVVSIFQVLFQELHLPIMEEFWGSRVAKLAAVEILSLVGLGLILISGVAIISGLFHAISLLAKRFTSPPD